MPARILNEVLESFITAAHSGQRPKLNLHLEPFKFILAIRIISLLGYVLHSSIRIHRDRYYDRGGLGFEFAALASKAHA